MPEIKKQEGCCHCRPDKNGNVQALFTKKIYLQGDPDPDLFDAFIEGDRIIIDSWVEGKGEAEFWFKAKNCPMCGAKLKKRRQVGD